MYSAGCQKDETFSHISILGIETAENAQVLTSTATVANVIEMSPLWQKCMSVMYAFRNKISIGNKKLRNVRNTNRIPE